jgi:hypothetical protein
MVYSRPIPMRISTSLAVCIVLAGAACGGKTPLPKGPPPEYEQEPAPSAEPADAGPPPVASPEPSTQPAADSGSSQTGPVP